MSPARIKHPCLYPGCGELVTERYCDKHTKATTKAYEATRETATARGYTYRWQLYRALYLKKHPLCVHCKADGRITPANEVDHIVPTKRGGDFWDTKNHQSLCKPCHSRKTIEDGRFE